MKKMIFIGIIGIILCIVSTATAVPTVQSQPLMNQIEKVEDAKSILQTGKFSLGILSSLILLITSIIKIIMKARVIYKNITTIISLIQTLFKNIQEFIDLINQFIQLITNNQNPESG